MGMMKSAPRIFMTGSICVWIAGCAQQPSSDTAFTVRKIDSSRVGSADAVRVRLSTPGQIAEADAGLIVQYVQVVAKREATKRQREVAVARARAAHRQITAGRKSRKARYLVVDTQKSESASGSRVAKSVMVWDTESQQIVGNNVYDIDRTPAVDAVVRFDTYSAQYIGVGF